jgi:hypothetical protein
MSSTATGNARRLRATLVAGALVLALAALPAAAGAQTPSAPEWQSFAGTWSASGHRRTIAVEGGGVAAVTEVSGAVVLSAGDALSRGFLGRAIGFDDGGSLVAGRCVWTDERGDQVFSRLRGESLATGRRVYGTITGGTGRYAALEGEYSLTWQYVVSGDDGLVQGRASDVSGRVRLRTAAP